MLLNQQSQENTNYINEDGLLHLGGVAIMFMMQSQPIENGMDVIIYN